MAILKVSKDRAGGSTVSSIISSPTLRSPLGRFLRSRSGGSTQKAGEGTPGKERKTSIHSALDAALLFSPTLPSKSTKSCSSSEIQELEFTSLSDDEAPPAPAESDSSETVKTTERQSYSREAVQFDLALEASLTPESFESNYVSLSALESEPRPSLPRRAQSLQNIRVPPKSFSTPKKSRSEKITLQDIKTFATGDVKTTLQDIKSFADRGAKITLEDIKAFARTPPNSPHDARRNRKSPRTTYKIAKSPSPNRANNDIECHPFASPRASDDKIRLPRRTQSLPMARCPVVPMSPRLSSPKAKGLPTRAKAASWPAPQTPKTPTHKVIVPSLPSVKEVDQEPRSPVETTTPLEGYLPLSTPKVPRKLCFTKSPTAANVPRRHRSSRRSRRSYPGTGDFENLAMSLPL
eukprot:Nitzschia sp. Nitz4//scaffold109_size72162//70920//72143//NITZ4_005860-RA/size72162-processed-gene-0.35-mRNA-1//-1//CDS//3329532805//3193//frame0